MKFLLRPIRNFFGFSRAQTNGFVALLVLITVALFSEPLWRWWISREPADFSADHAKLDSLTARWKTVKEEANRIPVEEDIPVSFFAFNPNTVSEEELQALGFSAGLAKRLINYREAGGQFRIKSDVKKLYGMDSAFYLALLPFIQLPEKITWPEEKRVASEKSKPAPFNLNEADTTQLQGIYGIGPVLSKRIIAYRERLGGFLTTQQLNEVYGLDSAVVNRIAEASFLAESFTPRTININTADENSLSVHPYLSKKLAKAIVVYRFQHGKFNAVDDLQKIHGLEKHVLDKIYPYLTVE